MAIADKKAPTESLLEDPKAITSQLSNTLDINDQKIATQKKYLTNTGEKVELVAMMPTP
jgi:predicted ribosome quality control (RQC) complex YloA/Tae2 family protein